MDNKKTYLDLSIATENNAYIMYYINETIQAVQRLEEYQELIELTLQAEHDKAYKQFKDNPNSTDYLTCILGDLEFSLSDLKRMIEGRKYSQMIDLAVQYVIEIVLSRFVKAYSRAYNELTELPEDIYSTSRMTALLFAKEIDVEILLDRDHPRHDEVNKKYGVRYVKKKLSVKQKFRLVPKVFKKMWTNMKNVVKSFGEGVNKLRNSQTFEEFKGRFKHYMKPLWKGPLKKMSKIKRFVLDPKFRKVFVKNYKLEWTQGGMMVIGMIGDAVQLYVQNREWRKVAVEMNKARKQYTKYRDNLKKELTAIDAQTAKLIAEWPGVIEIFKDISLSFKSMIDNASKYAKFKGVLGLVGVDSLLFSLNFDALTKSNLNSNQVAVIRFMKEADNDMTLVADQLRARTILYENVKKMVADRQSIKVILESSHNIYRFSSSQTVKDYGKSLRKRHIVCTVSILSKTKTEYDFYQLKPFRPRCDVSVADFQTMKTDAETARAAAETARAASDAVEEALTMCSLYKLCPCPIMIAQKKDVTEAVVIDLIRTLRPNMSQYCGMTGCKCVVFKD